MIELKIDRESPVRELWEQMLQEKYQELETLLQDPSPSGKVQTANSEVSGLSTIQENSQQMQDSLKDGVDVYELMSVLVWQLIIFVYIQVHSGSANGGHYYAFIKSFEDNLWYKFNDSSVNQVSVEVVKRESFGDKSMGSAYMLVYSRVTPEKLPQSISVPGWFQIMLPMTARSLESCDGHRTCTDSCFVN